MSKVSNRQHPRVGGAKILDGLAFPKIPEHALRLTRCERSFSPTTIPAWNLGGSATK